MSADITALIEDAQERGGSMRWQAAVDALLAENQRLRGALTEIDTFPISEELSAGYHFAEVRSIARAALVYS